MKKQSFIAKVKFVNGLRVLHEIQSRLQPAETEVVPVKEDLTKKPQDQNKSENEKKREQNRAFDPGKLSAMLASLMTGLPGGMTR